MIENNAYMELNSHLPGFVGFNCALGDLITAMRETSVRGFGWSVGLVMDVDDYKPKPFDGGIEAIIKTDESLDNWSLNLNSELFILQTLFEDRRDSSSIFIDTRLVRVFEALARTAALYLYLGAENTQNVKISLKHGGILNRKLSIASKSRYMPPHPDRICSVNEFNREIEKPLSYFLDINNLKEEVFQYCFDMFQVFDTYELNKDMALNMMDQHKVKRGVDEMFRILNLHLRR